jgi:hypothetical protein
MEDWKEVGEIFIYKVDKVQEDSSPAITYLHPIEYLH